MPRRTPVEQREKQVEAFAAIPAAVRRELSDAVRNGNVRRAHELTERAARAIGTAAGAAALSDET